MRFKLKAFKGPLKELPVKQCMIVKDFCTIPKMTKQQKALSVQQQFMWMLNACVIGDKFNTEEIINQYWQIAFNTPFPEEGGILDTLYTVIAQKIYEDEAIKYGVDLDEHPFKNVFNIMKKKNGNWNSKKGMHISKINLTTEDSMANKTKEKSTKEKSTKKGTKGTKVAKTEKDVKAAKKPPVEESGPKMTKKRLAEILCCKLLLKRKFTDAEIAKQIDEELEYSMIARRVGKRRKRLNTGDMEEYGFEAPMKPVKEKAGDEPASSGTGKAGKAEKVEKTEKKKKKMNFKLKKK